MEEERERTIDRFDLVRTYQNAESKEDFLYMLLNLEAVQAQSSMVSFIREVLHCMKQYARQHTLAVIKGIVSSVFPGKKENSGEVYERWEDTPDEKFQMTSGKKTKTGTVKQEHTRWSMTADNSDTLVLSDKSYVKTSGTAAIKLPGTAVYHGGIQFTFSME